MRTEILASPNFELLKRILRLTNWQAVGLLESIWWLASVKTPSGNIGKLTNQEIADEIGWEGDWEMLVQGLIITRWLLDECDHRLIVANWHQNMPEWLRRRQTEDRISDARSAELLMPSGPTEQFEMWYQKYPSHRQSAQTACARMFPTILIEMSARLAISETQAFERLLDITREFSESETGKGQFCWSSETFLRDGHWSDDPRSWNRTKQQSGKFDESTPVRTDGW